MCESVSRYVRALVFICVGNWGGVCVPTYVCVRVHVCVCQDFAFFVDHKDSRDIYIKTYQYIFIYM